MSIRTITIQPHNGLSIPKHGHLTAGEHRLELSAAEVKALTGVDGITLHEADAAKKTTKTDKV